MTHYVCPICGGVSDSPKVCETDGCERHGRPMVECRCTDSKHAEVMANRQPPIERENN